MGLFDKLLGHTRDSSQSDDFTRRFARARHAEKRLNKHYDKQHDDVERLIANASTFMNLSTLFIDMSELANTDKKQTIVHAYAYGVLDTVAVCAKIDHETTVLAAISFFMRYFQMSPEDAGLTLQYCRRMANHPQYKHYVLQGGRALLDMASDRDIDAPRRLRELLEKEDEDDEQSET